MKPVFLLVCTKGFLHRRGYPPPPPLIVSLVHFPSCCNLSMEQHRQEAKKEFKKSQILTIFSIFISWFVDQYQFQVFK